MSYQVFLRLDTREVMQAIGQSLFRFRNMRPALQEIADRLWSSILRNFQEGGRPVRWPPLRRLRRDQRGRVLGNQQPLIRTGALMRSVHVSPEGRNLVVATAAPRGRIHQLGGRFRRPGVVPRRARALRWWNDETGKPIFAQRVRSARIQIPARPFLVVQDEDWVAFQEIMERFIHHPWR